MAAPVYKKQGSRLYKIHNNIIAEIELSSYEHEGIISLAIGDVRKVMLQPNQYAKVVSGRQFEMYLRKYQKMIDKLNKI